MPKNSKTAKPYLVRLGRFVKNKIEEYGLKNYSFSQKYGFSNATISDITKAYYEPSREILEKVAIALSQHTGEDISLETLQALIDPKPDAAPDAAAKPDESAKRSDNSLPPSSVLWHFKRLGAEGRSEIAPDILSALAADWKESRSSAKNKSEVDGLVAAIDRSMKEWNVDTIEEFASQLLERNYLMRNHPDSKPLLAGLNSIVNEKKLPDQTDPAFNVTIDYLSNALDGGRFKGDGITMLKEYSALLLTEA